MVRLPGFKFRMFDRFRKEDGGVVLVEALISLPIVILMVTAMVELGFALYQWNQTVRAVQLGARLASVSDPLVADYTGDLSAGFIGSGSDPDVPIGDPVPDAIVSTSCGAGAAACNAAGLARLISGSNSACLSTDVGTMSGMCDLAPWIEADNVKVTYTRARLGYVGRPFGIVSTVTVEVRNLEFQFLLLDQLIRSSGIQIPAHPVTITSEDLAT